MNHYIAKKRQSDGKWDYTCNNRPTGYCHEWRDIDPKEIPISESQLEAYRASKDKYHSCGHDTEEEARECYKRYQLDNSLRFSTMSNQQLKCKVCGEWTQGFAEVDCSLFTLCDEHRNRETVEQIYKAPDESWSSW